MFFLQWEINVPGLRIQVAGVLLKVLALTWKNNLKKKHIHSNACIKISQPMEKHPLYNKRAFRVSKALVQVLLC